MTATTGASQPFPRPGEGRVVVVGAGTAGCVVAGRLAMAGHSVDLLDAGPAVGAASDARLASTDHLLAHRVTDRWWHTPIHRGDGVDDQVVPYLTGRGLGGSSAVNGLIADVDLDDPAIGEPVDVAAAFAACRLPIERPKHEELGELDRAVLSLRGARPLDLHRRDGRRADIAAAYLDRSLDLRIVGGAFVDRIVDHGRVGGQPSLTVSTVAGGVHDAVAVVVCAGTLRTPAILQRSGLGRQVGVGVQGHPAVSIPVVRRRPEVRSLVVTGVAIDRGPVQVMALDHVSVDPVPAGAPDAALLVALMRPIGAAGTIQIESDDPRVDPVVRVRSFDDRRDLEALRDGVRWTLDAVASPALTESIESVEAWHDGRRLSDLDDRHLDEWIRAEPGAHAHLVGGCSIGRTLSADGLVEGSSAVYVADASAFPAVPRTGPHLPTVLQAERLAARWCRAKMTR